MIKEYDGIKWYGYIRDGEKQYYHNPKYGRLHVYKYQKETGLELMDNQVVHHVDGDKHNNNIDNLVHMFKWCHRRMHSINMSTETRKKISDSKLGKKIPRHITMKAAAAAKVKNSKKVQCVETGIVYNSMVDAAKDMNTQQSNISHVCRGKYKTAGGYHWRRFYG